MNLNWKKIIVWILIIAGALLLVYLLLRFFGGSPSRVPNGTPPSFGNASNSGELSGGTPATPNQTPGSNPQNAATGVAQKVFLISEGPVIGATLLETPTTTANPVLAPAVARYITADDGHVLDQPLDVPGAAGHIVSQTTIPGIERALFTDRGAGALVQYLEGAIIKTAHLAFQTASSTQLSAAAGAASQQSIAPQTAIQFFPDNIEDVSVSPDGSSVVYLLHTSSGLDGYTSISDGSRAKKLFSLPLSEIAVSWPAPGTILAYSKAASSVPGIVFSINTKTGAVSPLLYGQGIIAAADQAFAHVFYQLNSGGTSNTYLNTIKTGATAPISGTVASINPEQCTTNYQQPVINGKKQVVSGSLFYCAAATGIGGSFIDLWHQGFANAADSFITLDSATGTTTLLVTPGSSDGGEQSDAMGLAISPLQRYLSFINRSNGKLWGIRLTP